MSIYNKWSLLICEGAHDQEFLLSLAIHSNGWGVVDKHSDVPRSIAHNKNARYIVYGDVPIVVVGLDGIDNILGIRGKAMVGSANTAHSVGIILDADDVGVAKRTEEVKATFSKLINAAKKCVAGSVVSSTEQPSSPAFGLWVAPNCKDNGSLDSVIRDAANDLHPALLTLSDKYITELGNSHNHSWTQYRDKATLGALGQLFRAGGSLASALQERDAWLNSATTKKQPFSSLVNFMEALVN